MTDDPRTWLNKHIEAGIHLREEARVALDPGAAWCERADKWDRDLISGVEAHSPRHASKVRTVGDVVPETLPVGHIWFEEAAVGLIHTSTGEGLPGNNPLSRLSARIRRAEEVAALWEYDPPEPTKEIEEKEPSSRGYAKADAPLIKRMHKMITENQGSITEASTQLAPEAVGGGTEESKAKRLERGYIEKYRS